MPNGAVRGLASRMWFFYPLGVETGRTDFEPTMDGIPEPFVETIIYYRAGGARWGTCFKLP